MNQSAVTQALKEVDLDGELQHVRTLTSAVTTAWGVEWDEDYIARDLMQNFFDANRERLREVVVQNVDQHVVVSAPAPFHLERLFYLGSEKGDDDVGQYGEGFKVAATCLLRDHHVAPIAISGHDVVALRMSDRTVADTKMSPIEYDFYRSSRETPGTVLILPGCSRKLKSAMSHGLSHFFYDENPLLGEDIWNYADGQFRMFRSTNSQGHIFYRHLKRGEIEGIPVVLVINKKYENIERKISKDRDRNAFGEEVMDLFYSRFAKSGLGYGYEGGKLILEAAKPLWQKGHPLLREVAAKAGHPWFSSFTEDIFGDKYFARSGRAWQGAAQLERERLEAGWEREGRIALPSYFRMFGVLNADDEIKRLQDEALKESKKTNKRPPTPTEYEAIHLLSRILNDLAPEVAAVFNRGQTSYTVARTDTLLGQLKSERHYRERDVFLAESVFVSDFADAVATFLHEHSHIFGHDGSRGFSDALTHLLETVIRQRHELDPLEQEWEKLRKSVRRERTKAAKSGDGLDGWLSGMSEDDLRSVIRRVPTSVLERLRKDADEGDSE